MAGMSRNNSAASLQGFSVFQPALGAALQFLPALGTPELDSLIDAFLPGPASLKDKRATLCMDFCEYARQTGETIKFYPVSSAPTSSPASSAAMYDSGYASSFNVSPAVSDMNLWGQSSAFTAPSTPASYTSASQSRTQSRTTAERKSSTASSRTPAGDFSHLPGMKIMTKDGEDVTNSASRGCKTKEQRDHAHLMRIMKACDACRRKKIRCDPSHKKRTASQAQTPPKPKPAKRARKSAAAEPPVESPAFSPDFQASGASFPFDTTAALPSVDLFTEPFEETWDQFIQFDDEPAVLPDYDYDFFFDPEGHFTPSPVSSVSSSQPFTPAPPGPSRDIYSGQLFTEVDFQEATLPYLNPGGHGTNYVDFNLYSPTSSFLDEDPLPLLRTRTGHGGANSERSRQHPLGTPAIRDGASAPSTAIDGVRGSPAASAGQAFFIGHSGDRPESLQAIGIPSPGWSVPGSQQTNRAAVSPSISTLSVDSISAQSTPSSTVSMWSRTDSLESLPLPTIDGISDSSTSCHHKSHSRTDSIATTANSNTLTTQSTLDAGCRRSSDSDPAPPQLHVKRCGKDEFTAASSSSSPVSAVRAAVSTVDAQIAHPSTLLYVGVSGGGSVQQPLGEGFQRSYRYADHPGVTATVVRKTTRTWDPQMYSPRQRGQPVPSESVDQASGLHHGERRQSRPYSAVAAEALHAFVVQPAGVGLSSFQTQAPRAEGAGVHLAQQRQLSSYGTASQDNLGYSVMLLAAAVLFAQPIRKLVDGSSRNSGLSIFVGFGIVSLLALCAFQLQSAGSFSELFSKLPAITLSLAPMTLHQSPSSPSTSLGSYTIANTKSKLRRVSSRIHELHCMITRRGRRSRSTGVVQSLK